MTEADHETMHPRLAALVSSWGGMRVARRGRTVFFDVETRLRPAGWLERWSFARASQALRGNSVMS